MVPGAWRLAGFSPTVPDLLYKVSIPAFDVRCPGATARGVAYDVDALGADGRDALCVAGGRLAAQDLPAKNPLEGNPDAIRAGMGLFRARCADCHGMDARGVRGPDITQVWASGRTDDGLFQTLRNGVPGTEMPANPRVSRITKAWQILAYLRTLAAPAPTDPPRGNAENGERCSARSAPAAIASTAPAAGSVPTCRASASRARAT